MSKGRHRAEPGVSVLDHVMALLNALELRLEQRWQAQEAAVKAALVAIGARLDLLNESRGTISDTVAKQVTADRFDTKMKALDDKIADLTARVGSSEASKKGQLLGWQLVSGAALLGLALYAAFGNR